MKREGILLVISGPSGSGKGVLVQKILSRRTDIGLSVSATTRAPRTGEVNGVSYHFMTKERFKEQLEKGDFLEYNEYAGNFYGTPRSEVVSRIADGISVILEIDVHGAMNIKRQYPDAVLLMIAPPDYPTLEKRLRGRGDDVAEEVIQKRLATAKDELAQLPAYDYLVINLDGEADKAADEISAIIDAEKNKVSRTPGFTEQFYGSEKLFIQ